MKYFILGILFVTVVLPLIDGLVSIAEQAIQLIKAKIGLQVYKLNQQVEAAQQEQPQEKHYGFYEALYPVPIQQEDQPEEE